MTSQESDAALIEASLGEPERFAEIFDRHFDEILHYAVRRLGPELGADIASEVFLTAFARRTVYSTARGTVRAWLFGITTNVIRHSRRAERRRLTALAREAALTPRHTSEINTPDYDPRLPAALASISITLREVLWIIDGIGMSYAEAASILTIPIGTVQSRLSRARAKVRATIQADSNSAGTHFKEGQSARD